MYGLQFARSLLFLALAGGVRTYNVDERVRTVITSGLSASSVAEEFFGFSMDHHRYSDGSQALFVGAPQALYDDPDFGTLTTGLVYKCEIANGSQCQPDPIFNDKRDSVPIGFLQPVEPLETKGYALAGQMLGFSIRSFGAEGILACAPLYLDNIETEIPPPTSGRCIFFEQDFNSTSLPLQYVEARYGGNPLLLGVDTVYTDVSGAALFIGGIGGRESGTVYGIAFPTDDESTSEFGPSNSDLEGYYGYHLETANFSDSIRGNILMSGPAGVEHVGEVVPLVYAFAAGSSSDLQQIVANDLATLTGPADQPDSYFGYDFAVLQLEKDGYDSVVVGCPLCSQDKGELYVYLHKGIHPMGAWTEFADKSTIEAPSLQKGRFGMQVENIGDIDLDGFDDLAVSAPYVDDGVVYIFRGTQAGLSDVLQTIRPRTGILGFGYVLTGNFDVDGNNYTDFAIGGFPGNPAGSIEIMRASPVAIIEPSFKEGNETMEMAVTYSCEAQGRRLLCFTLTPCFTFSTVEGDIPRFAFNYTLVVDEELNRVSLSNDFRKRTVNKEYVADESFSCDEPVEFALSAAFAAAAPIPASLVVSTSDNPLVVESPQDDTFGGPLTPVLGQYIAGNISRSLSTNLTISLNQSCGEDGICDPEFLMDVDYNVSLVYLAPRFQFGFDVTLENTGEDSFASFLEISLTQGIALDSFESITPFAIVRCETLLYENASVIQCQLQNPFESGAKVRARIVLRPNLDEISLNVSSLWLNFSVGDDDRYRRIHVSKFIVLESTSVAGFNLNTGFGNNDIQASFLSPADDFKTTPVRDLGILVAYTITLSPTFNDLVGSTIPRLVATITWPTAIRDETGVLNPLLIIVDETSISATCEEQDLYPYEISEEPAFANISESVSNTNCPSNLTCGILQCTFFNLLPISVDNSSAAPPLNILIQAILYGPSLRGRQNIPVHVTVKSESEYPMIEGNEYGVNSTALLTVTQAVTEFLDSDSCSLVPFIITIIVSAVFGLVVVVIVLVAMCGKRGHYYLEHREDKKILELRKSEQDVVDGSYNSQRGTRTIPPPGEIDIGTELKKGKSDFSKAEEAELEDQVLSKHLEAVLDPESAGETEL